MVLLIGQALIKVTLASCACTEVPWTAPASPTAVSVAVSETSTPTIPVPTADTSSASSVAAVG